jgi:hypothetical protein
MLRKLGWFVFVLRHTLGIIAFTALFSAPIPLQLKVFLGSSLLLIALYYDATIIEHDHINQQLISLLELGFTHLEAAHKDSSNNPASEAFRTFWTQRRFDEVASGDGTTYILGLLAKYLIWVCSALALSNYLSTVNGISG